MPATLNCFDLVRHHATLIVQVRNDVGRVPARDFGIEANLIRNALTDPALTNLLIEVRPASGLTAEQLRGLVFLLREARQRGGQCAFCGGGPQMQQTLARFGLAKPADWFPTPADGLAAFQSAPAPPPASAPAVAPARHAIVSPAAAPRPAAPHQPKAPWTPPPRGTFFPAHELTLRAHHRQPILVTPLVCAHLAQQIRAVSDQYKFSVWAFVFMPDHFHLLVQSKQLNYDIGEYLEAIKLAFHEKAVEILGLHAPQVLGRLRKQQGGKYVYDFWQKTSGQNRNVEYSLPVRPLIQYLHENPVRRGLVAHALDWKWSSAGAYAGRPLAELQPDEVPPALLGD